MKITKKFCSVAHILDMKWTEFKGKIKKKDRIELMKFLCLVAMTKDIYLKIDVVDYRIFITLLVNDIKIISSNIDNLF